MFNVEIVADSLSPQGERLTSALITFPRIILAEINTHRMLSKNTASSRAIPFKKMVEAIETNPFIPIAWQKEHKGMQGSEYIIDEERCSELTNDWLEARDNAVKIATRLNSGFYIDKEIGFGEDRVTKQLCNRLLEPFMWTTMLITGSKEGWDNFFELRCPAYTMGNSDGFYKSKKDLLRAYPADKSLLKDTLYWLSINKGQAEIHMMLIAEKIYDAMNESIPEQLSEGMCHIPFMSRIDSSKLQSVKGVDVSQEMIKISTAMAARTSYTVVGDEKEVDYERMIGLHDRLIAQNPPHSSPMEHCARAMSDQEYESFIKGLMPSKNSDSIQIPTQDMKGWCRNYKGFIPYRHFIETKYECMI